MGYGSLRQRVALWIPFDEELTIHGELNKLIANVMGRGCTGAPMALPRDQMRAAIGMGIETGGNLLGERLAISIQWPLGFGRGDRAWMGEEICALRVGCWVIKLLASITGGVSSSQAHDCNA